MGWDEPVFWERLIFTRDPHGEPLSTCCQCDECSDSELRFTTATRSHLEVDGTRTRTSQGQNPEVRDAARASEK